MILILSGPSGSGKTSACAIIAKKAAEAGETVAGVVCGALFEGGGKVGIAWADISSGPDAEPRLLARAEPGMIATKPDSRRPSVSGKGSIAGRGSPFFDGSDGRVIRYGMWEFDRAALAAADESASGSVARIVAGGGSGAFGGIAIVDEIGPLELDRGVGMVRTLAALDKAASEPDARAACIVVARPDIAERLVSRWPGCSVMAMAGRAPGRIAGDALAACLPAPGDGIGITAGTRAG